MKTTLNYGALKETVTKVAAMEVMRENEDKNKTLFNFQNLIQESTLLKKQHLIYKNIQTAKPFKKERLAERFLQQNLKTISNSKWNDIIKENKNARFRLFGGINEQVGEGGTVLATKDHAELFESIHTLIEAETNNLFENYTKESEAYEYVINYLLRESNEKSEETSDSPKFNKFWKYLTKNAVNNFEKRYSHLSESEKKVFKILVAEGDVKLNYINQTKQDVLDLINEKSKTLPKEDVIKLESFRKKINQEVDPQTLIGDDYIFEVTQLLNVLKEI